MYARLVLGDLERTNRAVQGPQEQGVGKYDVTRANDVDVRIEVIALPALPGPVRLLGA